MPREVLTRRNTRDDYSYDRQSAHRMPNKTIGLPVEALLGRGLSGYFTVSVACELVSLPSELVTWQLKRALLSAACAVNE